MKIRVVDNILIRESQCHSATGDIWFIHGMGGSGFCFREAFDSPLIKKFNLYAPDFPGFGASPLKPDQVSMQSSVEILIKLIDELSSNRPLYLVGHSLGGTMGVMACQKLGEKVNGFVSIEGNMTGQDVFYSRMASDYDTAKDYYTFFCSEMLRRIERKDILRRFYASLRFAHPEAFYAWAKDLFQATGDQKAADEFKALTCKKMFFWGDKKTSEQTQKYLKDHSIPNKFFKGSNHWIMIDQSEKCYEEIFKFFSRVG